MGKTTKRRGEREQFWRQLIGEQRRSGTSIKAFCRLHRVSEPSFFAWRKRFALNKHAGVKDDFVAVHLRPNAEPRPGNVEIVLDRGCRVRVEPGFDRQVLRDVLAVLEERPC